MADDERVGGVLEHLALEDLDPDAWNPRLPPATAARRLPRQELFELLDRVYDALSIAQSIKRHGYFEAEPLVAIPAAVAYDDDPGPEAEGRYVVVEGNRRLTALNALVDDDLRARLAGERSGWRKLAGVNVPARLPVLIVADRQRAAPILGYRHITRAAPWEPLPQAKYITDLIEGGHESFADVAALLNRKEADVRSAYRNLGVYVRAVELGLPDPDRILENFGTFNRAMQNPGVRAFIGAPGPKQVDPEYHPFSDDALPLVAELTTWLFGEPRAEEGAEEGPGRVVTDSRMITKLGRVLESADALEELRASGDLDAAADLLRDPREGLTQALRATLRAIANATRAGVHGAEMEQARRAVESALESLRDD